MADVICTVLHNSFPGSLFSSGNIFTQTFSAFSSTVSFFGCLSPSVVIAGFFSWSSLLKISQVYAEYNSRLKSIFFFCDTQKVVGKIWNKKIEKERNLNQAIKLMAMDLWFDCVITVGWFIGWHADQPVWANFSDQVKKQCASPRPCER